MTESDYKKALGRRIARIRKQRGLSQSDLADRVNLDSAGRCALTQNAVSRIELGTRDITLVEGTHLANVLDTTVEKLTIADMSGVETWAAASASAYRTTVERRNRLAMDLGVAEATAQAMKYDAALRWKQAQDESDDERLLRRIEANYRAVGLDDIVDGTVTADDLDPFKETK